MWWIEIDYGKVYGKNGRINTKNAWNNGQKKKDRFWTKIRKKELGNSNRVWEKHFQNGYVISKVTDKACVTWKSFEKWLGIKRTKRETKK